LLKIKHNELSYLYELFLWDKLKGSIENEALGFECYATNRKARQASSPFLLLFPSKVGEAEND